MKKQTSAIIVCAGNSSRMNSQKSKQFIEIDNNPILSYTLSAFEKSEFINEIIVVARECDFDEIFKIKKKYNITKLKDVVKGGDTRQKSVLNGVLLTSENSEFLAIHDGARPLIKTKTIDETVNVAFEKNACTVAVEVVDTLKIAQDNLKIVKTVSREGMWSIQTPQVFSKQLYLKAVEKAEQESKDFTDDCQLVENIGVDVFVVRGEKSNIKITYNEDIEFANALIKSQKECL